MRHIGMLCALALAGGLASCGGDVPPTSVSLALMASAGPDQVVECASHAGAIARLDGSASDFDGQPVILEWRGPFGTVTGPQPSVTLPIGRHEVTLTATNRSGETSSDIVVIEVVDTRAPEITSVTASSPVLWPPNHTMVPVIIAVDVSDVCHASPACRITGVTSNEPVNALGDGNTAPDWNVTGPLTVELRAERSGTGTGRIYTITVQCTDASGNTSSLRDVVVTVPHDQGKSAE